MNRETLARLAEDNMKGSSGSLKDFQATHLSLFKRDGLRPKAVDSYKFTHPELFFKDSAREEGKSGEMAIDSHFPSIHFLDGKFTKNDLKIPGLTVKNLRENFDEVKHLFKDENALSSLHHALLTDGIIIEVAKNVAVGFPVKIQHTVRTDAISAPAVIVIGRPFSKLCLIEEVTGSKPYHHLSETYLDLQDGAKMEHILVNQENSEAVAHTSVYANVTKDALFRSFIFNTSGRINRKNLSLNLTHSGAHGESFALYLTSGKDHSDVNTVINHLAPDTTSDQIAKGILDGDSKGIFTGKIHIFPKAQRVASGQLNKNLLLSKKAQAHSQPQLEIFADDVKCSHGSTTGQLSDDEIFYFETRGIPADKAKTLLAHGFGLEVVQKIENEEARKEIASFVLKTLETKFHLGGTK